MNVPIVSLAVAMLLPYVWAGASSLERKRQFGKLDNNHPRDQQSKLTGTNGRGTAAMANAFEALAVFGPAVVAQQVAAPASTLAPTLCVVWMIARVGHGIVYIANLATLRSTLFFVGLCCALGLVLVSLHVL